MDRGRRAFLLLQFPSLSGVAAQPAFFGPWRFIDPRAKLELVCADVYGVFRRKRS